MRRLLTLLTIGLTLGAVAQAAELDPDAVATRVGGEPISVRVIERELKRATPELPADAVALRRLRAAAAEATVKRALVQLELSAQKKAATGADIDQAMGRLKKELAARDTTWEQHLADIGLTEAEYRAELRWRMSWEAYLQEQLTDENLRRYYERHRAEFDGTRLRVAHILLKAAPDDTGAGREAQLAKAEQIRGQLRAGKLTFAEAAAKYSDSPTAKEGGDIGFIARRQPMPESFSKAAFALETGEISAPVETAFGVHLITCLEVTPGQRTWQEAREDLRTAVTRYLFDWLSDRQAKLVEVEFTSAYPRINPFSGVVEGPE